MRPLSENMRTALAYVPDDWGPVRDVHVWTNATRNALLSRELIEFRQIDDPHPKPPFAPGKIGQHRKTEAGKAVFR